jgi:hypothetical protein
LRDWIKTVIILLIILITLDAVDEVVKGKGWILDAEGVSKHAHNLILSLIKVIAFNSKCTSSCISEESEEGEFGLIGEDLEISDDESWEAKVIHVKTIDDDDVIKSRVVGVEPDSIVILREGALKE